MFLRQQHRQICQSKRQLTYDVTHSGTYWRYNKHKRHLLQDAAQAAFHISFLKITSFNFQGLSGFCLQRSLISERIRTFCTSLLTKVARLKHLNNITSRIGMQLQIANEHSHFIFISCTNRESTLSSIPKVTSSNWLPFGCSLLH